MNYCKNCGNELSDADNFCKNCGAMVGNSKEDLTLKHKQAEDMQLQVVNQDFENEEDYDEEYDEDRKINIRNKLKFIIPVLSILFIIAVLFIYKNSIMSKYYCNKADKQISETKKIYFYNKALGYEYNEEILNKVYDVVKDTDNFEEEVFRINRLKQQDKNKLLLNILVYKANDSFSKENYKRCDEFLEKAKSKGYDRKQFTHCDELAKKLEESKTQIGDNSNNKYTYKNSMPTIGDSYVNTLGDVYFKDHRGYDGIEGYIIPGSNERYLSEDELSNYDKYTLDLIRNEIYARHGFVFGVEPFKTYFENKNWYYKDEFFKGDDCELNDYEIQNVRLILKLASKK